MTNGIRHYGLSMVAAAVTAVGLAVGGAAADNGLLEHRIELVIKNYEFVLSQPGAVRLHQPTVLILRNQDIVRHGFTSPMLAGLLIRGEGEGVLAYGKGIEGFQIDPNKTLVIRLTPERAGRFTFQCDLHPSMKNELYSMEVPAA